MSGTWTTILLGLGTTVIVGLGLRVAAREDHGPRAPMLTRVRRWHPAAATFAVGSLVLEPGAAAAAVAAPWLGFTAVVAAVGIARLLSRRPALDAAMGVDVGMVFLAVGGAWLVIDRAGLRPLGFEAVIVELTVVHFHYAGFALPIAAGAAASRLGSGIAVPALVTVGVPLTAIGFTIGGTAESLAATVMIIGGLGAAVLLLRLGAKGAADGASRALLSIAGIALACGMILAAWWAWSSALGWTGPTLDLMARTHGTLNALGFGVLGLLGLVRLAPGTPHDATEVLVHLGRSAGRRLAHLQGVGDRTHPTSDPALLADERLPAGYERFGSERSLSSDDLDAARQAIETWAAQRGAGIRLHPPRPPVEVGSTLALLGPLGPLAFSATCRITEVVDEADRVGFVYTTLPHHPEAGSEVFEVTRGADGGLVARIEAVWRPGSVATAWCRPLTRLVQRRYVERYLDGMQAAVESGARSPAP